MEEPDIARWTLIRDSFIFQLKLAMDAIRDLLLSPVSIICTVIDIFCRHTLSQSYFHKLMLLGHKSDHWLNLFGTHDEKSLTALSSDISENSTQAPKVSGNVDQLFAQVESLLKDQHEKGGLTASAKTTIDRYLNKIIEKNTTKKSDDDNII